MIKTILPLTAFFLALPATAFAAQQDTGKPAQDQSEQAQNDESAEAKSAKDEVICRRDKVIGSRVKSEEICKTRAQWEAEKAEGRQEVEKMQAGRYKNN